MSLADLLVGELMFSSLAVALLLSLVLYWARGTQTPFFIKLLMVGLLIYNVFLSVLTFLSLIGVSRANSTVASVIFFIYVQTHVVKAASIVLFCLYMLGIKIPEPVATTQKVVIVGVEIPKTEDGKPLVTMPVTVEGPIPMPTSAAQIAAAQAAAEADTPIAEEPTK